IPQINHPSYIPEARPELAATGFNKLHLWNLTAYDRVIYLDADAFVLQDVRWIWDAKYWRYPVNSVAELGGQMKGGFLAVRPDAATFHRLVKALDQPIRFGNNEMGFLNAVLKEDFGKVPAEDRLPSRQHLCAARCVLEDGAVRLEFAYQLIEAGIMDFQGKAKPWSWPASIHQQCSSVVAFAGVWQAILVAPGHRWVRFVLDRFGTEQRLLNVNQPSPERITPLVEKVLNLALQVQRLPGTFAYNQVFSLLCGAGILNKHDVWSYFVDTTRAVESSGMGDFCRRWRSAKQESGPFVPTTLELSGWVPAQELSVVIPCTLRDAKRKFALRDLLETVLEQTLHPLEVVLALSDASTAEATALERKLTRVLGSIPLIVDAVEGSASAAENRDRGLRRARGDILSVFDADDLMHPQRIELISKAFFSTPGLKMLLHSYYPLFNNSQIRTCVRYDLTDRLRVLPSRDLLMMDQVSQAVHMHDMVHEIFNSGAAMRREVVEQYTYNATPEAATREDDSGFTRAVVRGYGVKDLAMEEGEWALPAGCVWFGLLSVARNTWEPKE
ncbi:gyg-1, partial [Symbiodinium sp. CCMP2456]